MYYLAGSFERDDEGWLDVVMKKHLVREDFENARKSETFQILHVTLVSTKQYNPVSDSWEDLENEI